MKSTNTARERAEQDAAAGDLGSARQRLASLLISKGYDPELVAKLGRLSLQMGDLEGAGRYFILSTETGEDVERAIGAFVRRHGGNRKQLLRQLPRPARHTLDRLPEAIQVRLEAFGIDRATRVAAVENRETTEGGRLFLAGCLVLALLAFGVFVVGVATTVRWLAR